ncbi:MAG: hypothetical protein KTR31_22935 [Myxococcales bacterium]|nr:hypothetical protein [Myxococcales bacterium]
MDRDFWLDRWSTGRTGFHRDDVHPDLIAHADWLLPSPGQRVWVPLCGRSRDLAWLAEAGHRAVGVELASSAVRGVFDDWGRAPQVTSRGELEVYEADGVEIWCGDFFALPDGLRFDGVWDRAALVALPPERRRAYVERIRRMAAGGRLLLNVVDYDPTVMTGPPFPVTPADVEALYGADRVDAQGHYDLIEAEPRWRERGHRWFRVGVYRVQL